MGRMRDKLIERRKFIRLLTPVNMTYTVPDTNKIYSTITKNVSADGLRFETHDKDLKASDAIELKLEIVGVSNPVHCKGKVVWKRKMTTDDAAPYDVGVEFIEIEDDNKNTFLKFLCDLIYSLPEGE